MYRYMYFFGARSHNLLAISFSTCRWEGGVREPGIVHWPGVIAPFGLTHAVAATYDIFATVLALAGVPLPADRIIDGRDLTPLFTNTSAEIRREDDCIFVYKGTPGLRCPTGHPACPGLWAVRCGMVKMHYVTSNWSHSDVQTFHDPPLAFHLGHDPGERLIRVVQSVLFSLTFFCSHSIFFFFSLFCWCSPGESYPLDSSDPIYLRARPIIDAAKQEHLATLVAVPNQMAKGVDPRLMICKDPHSRAKHPKYPNCTSNPENFAPDFVCTSIGVQTAASVTSGGSAQEQREQRVQPLFDQGDARTWPRQARVVDQTA